MTVLALAALLLLPSAAPLVAQEGSAYHRANRDLLRQGRHALTVCNGLFLSGRSLDQLYAGELQRFDAPPRERTRVDREAETVAVEPEAGGDAPTMRAALRPGLGCVVMAPGQTFADTAGLPALQTEPFPGDADTIPWPTGDRLEREPLPEGTAPAGVDGAALEAAGEWTFDRTAHGGHEGQVTLSLLVVHDGDLVYERYAEGVDRDTRTRTWSAAKSIASTLIGIARDRGLLELDEPLPVDWVPDELAEYRSRAAADFPMIEQDRLPPEGWEPPADPRERITLRHVLHMSSGLHPVDNEFWSGIGSPLSYFAGWSSARGARNRGLMREPGAVWDYENYDTLLGLLALRSALGDRRTYLRFPRRALFREIGMRSTVPGVDRFGDFVMSSQVYTNARDLARLGLLYLDRGAWEGRRVLPASWVDFVRTPAPATGEFGRFYGGQWWLVPDERTDLPQDAYTAAGSGGQYVVAVPSRDLVVVRRGLDHGGGTEAAPPFSVWDMLGRVLEAFPGDEDGEKPPIRD